MEPGAGRALVMAAVASAFVLSGCSGSGAPVFAAQPAWESGFAWTYSTMLEREWREMENGERDNGTMEAMWREVVEVLNTTQMESGHHYYVMGSQQSGDQDRLQVQLIRQRDLDHLPFSSSWGSSCNGGACSFHFKVTDVNVSSPTFLDFPLERGKRWGEAYTEPDSSTRLVHQAEVDGAFKVQTGLGEMSAARVSIAVQPVDVAALRMQIMQDGEAQGYRVDDLRVSMSERRLVYYSSDYQAVVRTDVRSHEAFYARGTDPDGEPFEFDVEATMRRTSVLEGARLVPRPERTLDEVAAFLAGELALRDPTGQALGTVSYKLAVDPPQATVNVGAGEQAEFRAVVDGSMPEAHALQWQLLDEQGRRVASGRGDAFTAAPGRPGRYMVELESFTDNRSVAAAGAALVGDWHTLERVDCAPVSVFSTCAARPLPVHPGVRSLLVQVTPQDLVAGLADVAYVTDSAGTRIEGTETQGTWTVSLDPVAGYLVDADPWSLDFRRGVAGPSSVDVEVRVLYSGAATPSEPAQVPGWHGVFKQVAPLPQTIA